MTCEDDPTASTDPIEQALAVALQLAAEAGQWEACTTLARELAERRRERVAPDVASLGDERAKRGKDG